MNGRRRPRKDGPWTVSFETITFEPPFASFLRGFFQEKSIVSCGTCKIAEVNSRADCVAEAPLCRDTGLRIKVPTVRHRPNQAGVECRDMRHAQLGPRRQEPRGTSQERKASWEFMPLLSPICRSRPGALKASLVRFFSGSGPLVTPSKPKLSQSLKTFTNSPLSSWSKVGVGASVPGKDCRTSGSR